MKYRKTILLTHVLLLGGLMVQAQTSLRGDWQGTLRLPMGSLRLILHLNQDEQGKWQGALDSPDQGAYGLRVDEVQVEGDSLLLTSHLLQIRYLGLRDASGKILGTLTQGGAELPLTLERKREATEPLRADTITSPYRQQELQIPIPGTKVTLSGTLSLPTTERPPHALVVLITGSGPQDRDETILGHKPFRHIADTLLSAGYAVFCYDDRGVGKSTGVFMDSHLSDFVQDATAVVRRLHAEPSLRGTKIYLLGHSEGAYVAAQVARRESLVSGVISLAGPTFALDRVLLDQMDALLELSGASEDQRRKLGRVNAQVYALMKDRHLTLDEVKAKARKVLESHQEYLGNGQSIEAILGQLTPYLRELLSQDVSAVWRDLRVPVIGIYADLDKQVLPINARELQRLLPRARVQVFPGYNHLFLQTQSGSPLEYARLPQGFSPEALSYLRQELDRLRVVQ